ncbi:MAG: hypothetical protein ACTS6A_00785 [Candidatus Hodgkinia cicadicola]
MIWRSIVLSAPVGNSGKELHRSNCKIKLFVLKCQSDFNYVKVLSVVPTFWLPDWMPRQIAQKLFPKLREAIGAIANDVVIS